MKLVEILKKFVMLKSTFDLERTIIVVNKVCL